jgi:hypothetical protein
VPRPRPRRPRSRLRRARERPRRHTLSPICVRTLGWIRRAPRTIGRRNG